MGESSSATERREGNLNLPNSPFWLSAGIFFFCAVIGSYMPVFPVYLKALGVTASGFALIQAIQSLTAFLASQPLGYIADTMMRRTTLMMMMGIGGIGAAIMYPMLPPQMLYLCLGMVVLSFFITQQMSLYNAMILDSERGEERYSVIRGVGSVGFVVFTPLIGFLADRFGPGIMWPAIIVFLFFYILSVSRLKDLPPHIRSKGAERLSFAKAQKLLLSNPILRWFLLFVFLTQSTHLPGHILQLMLLRNLEVSALFISSTVTWAAICEILVFALGPKIIANFDMMRLLSLIPLAIAVRFYLVFAFSDYPWVIFASNTLHMVTFGLAYLTAVIFVNREVPRELKSSGQAVVTLVFMTVSGFVGNIAGAGMMYIGADLLGMSDKSVLSLYFGLSACFMGVSALAYIPLKKAYRRRHRTLNVN